MLKYLQSLIRKKANHPNVLSGSMFEWRAPGSSYVVDAKEYSKNPIVYRCVKLVAESASHVPLLVFRKNGHTKVRDNMHICNKLFRRPNPQQGGTEFFAAAITNKLLFGESYLMLAKTENFGSSPHLEMYLLDNMRVSTVVENNILCSYSYEGARGKLIYPIDPLSRQSKILHLKNYNPFNHSRGMSCLNPASSAIALNKMAGEWNYALLKNGARPSGAIIVKDGNRYLREDQFERLKEEIQEKYSSSVNAGRPMLLEGGLDWKEMSMSPKDMDFSESKDASSREIALSCGVPPQLLGIKGDNTYSNMKEARIALWEETIIPLLDKISDSLSNWISYWLQEDLIIQFNRDEISALTERRENLWSKITNVDFMTINEKREFVGLPPLPGGNTLSKADLKS
jgi:HK97 family phage portal protein